MFARLLRIQVDIWKTILHVLMNQSISDISEQNLWYLCIKCTFYLTLIKVGSSSRKYI